MLTDCFECLSSADYGYALARWELFESGLVKSEYEEHANRKSSKYDHHLIHDICHPLFMASFGNFLVEKVIRKHVHSQNDTLTAHIFCKVALYPPCSD
jgi:hypothetical protein